MDERHCGVFADRRMSAFAVCRPVPRDMNTAQRNFRFDARLVGAEIDLSDDIEYDLGAIRAHFYPALFSGYAYLVCPEDTEYLIELVSEHHAKKSNGFSVAIYRQVLLARSKRVTCPVRYLLCSALCKSLQSERNSMFTCGELLARAYLAGSPLISKSEARQTVLSGAAELLTQAIESSR